MKIGFDNDKYLKMQSEHIRERIGKFGGKLYLEFGGKLFDDYHASRVLPGFEPDSKLRLLKELSDQAEIVFAISAKDIEKNKIRGDLGITYDSDVIRLIGTYREQGLFVGSVVITQFSGQESALLFKNRLENLGISVYIHYNIPGYPSNIPLIVSENGYGKNDYIETSHPLVIVTAPGPGSGKMAVCLSQLYQEHQRGIEAGYAKFETFPIWNLPLKHPVNLAYEAATADLNDVNMIDPYHLEAYGVTTVNYNRDVEIFPVLNTIFEKIYGSSPYKSPTDMGVNMAGNCICDDEACREASRQEIIRRYYAALNALLKGDASEKEAEKIELLMNMEGKEITEPQAEDLGPADRWILSACNNVVKDVTENLDKFELGIALSKIYDFIWDEFCDWYIELSKYAIYHADENPKSANAALWTLKKVLGDALKLLHPYMPFVTEEIYSKLVPEEESLMMSSWPVYEEKWNDAENENILNHYKEIVRGVRNVRSEMNVPNSRKATIYVVCEDEKLAKGLAVLKESAMMMASAGDFIVQADKSGIADDAVSVVVPDATVYVPLEELIDFEQEKERLTKEETRLNKEIARSNGMLNNEKFVSKAPAAKVQEEREKLEKYEQMLAQVKERLAGLQKK